MENEKETKLEASGRFAEIGAMQIKEAAPSPKPSGRFAHLSGIEVKPATDESDVCPTCGKRRCERHFGTSGLVTTAPTTCNILL